jgi:hypothetical protein
MSTLVPSATGTSYPARGQLSQYGPYRLGVLFAAVGRDRAGRHGVDADPTGPYSAAHALVNWRTLALVAPWRFPRRVSKSGAAGESNPQLYQEKRPLNCRFVTPRSDSFRAVTCGFRIDP